MNSTVDHLVVGFTLALVVIVWYTIRGLLDDLKKERAEVARLEAALDRQTKQKLAAYDGWKAEVATLRAEYDNYRKGVTDARGKRARKS